jgi:hypothetical protein
MSHAQRVVIRCSWTALFASVGPVAVGLLFVQAIEHSLGGAIAVLVAISGAVAVAHALFYIELTPAGLGIHWLAMTTVPWQHIGSVDYVRSFGSAQLKVGDRAANRGRRLPAPRELFGLGRTETQLARDAIEQWWLIYRGADPLVAPVPAPTRETPGDPVDPWAPPAEG